MNRKSKQVSLEPYGYTFARRPPVKVHAAQIESKAVEPIEVAPTSFAVTDVSSTPNPVETVQTIPPKTGNPAGCAAWCIVIGLGFFVLAALSSFFSSTPNSTYSNPNNDAGMACIMAEKLIKPQLKAPSSAEFDYADCKASAFHNGTTWSIRSYVDADNSFGAHIRTHYVAKLTNVPPSNTWRIVELTFDDP